jgi:putative peptide zinc metalloprotease protein
LAGVVVQSACAGLVAVAATFVGGGWHRALLTLAAACYLGAVFNLLPLVKFDGYIALMSELDVPYLRDKAMQDWRGWVARVVFGARQVPRQLPGRRWAVLYGLGCAVAPLVLVGSASWSALLAASTWGRLGAVVRLLVVLVIVGLLGRSANRVLAAGRSGSGCRRWRAWLGGSVVLAALVTVAIGVPVTKQVRGGYWVEPDGQAVFVVGTARQGDGVVAGRPVTLERQGLLLTTVVGRAQVTGPGRTSSVPFEAVVPFVRTGVRTNAEVFAVGGLRWSGPHDGVGAARLTLGTERLGGWLADQLVLSPWRDLIG